MNKVIITGATGFIGTALSKRLLDLGVEVIALSRSLDVPESLCANEKYQHVCMDVNDISKLEDWQERAKTSRFYKNAIYVWTNLDVRKQKCAKENNLNYKVIY